MTHLEGEPQAGGACGLLVLALSLNVMLGAVDDRATHSPGLNDAEPHIQRPRSMLTFLPASAWWCIVKMLHRSEALALRATCTALVRRAELHGVPTVIDGAVVYISVAQSITLRRALDSASATVWAHPRARLRGSSRSPLDNRAVLTCRHAIRFRGHSMLLGFMACVTAVFLALLFISFVRRALEAG